VLGAIERRANGWRTNLARGGAARSITLPDDLASLAIRAAAAVGAAYAGVDLLTSTDGTVYVLEVNGIPGWKGLQEATGVDVAGTLVDFLTLQSR
jgi:glutathione synthase/RimK-type ligase-like ATP-grasp enzyme